MREPCQDRSNAVVEGSSPFIYRPRAGPTNTALGLIDFPDLASYERYREKLAADPGNVESLRRAEAAGCILNEDRSFIRRISE